MQIADQCSTAGQFCRGLMMGCEGKRVLATLDKAFEKPVRSVAILANVRGCGTDDAVEVSAVASLLSIASTQARLSQFVIKALPPPVSSRHPRIRCCNSSR